MSKLNFTYSAPIRIIIANPNAAFIKEFIDFITSDEDMEVVGATEHYQDIPQLILKHNPDVLLYDIDKSQFEAYEVLKKLKNNNSKCKIIIISAISDDSFFCHAMEMGAIYFITKPVSMEKLVRNVMLVSRLKKDVSTVKEVGPGLSFPMLYYKEVTKILNIIGFNTKHKGFIYIREAALIRYKYNEVHNLSKDIYPFISEKYKVSPESVERAIRNAIDHAWNSKYFGNIETNYGLYYQKDEKPSNSVLISTVVDILRIGEPYDVQIDDECILYNI